MCTNLPFFQCTKGVEDFLIQINHKKLEYILFQMADYCRPYGRHNGKYHSKINFIYSCLLIKTDKKIEYIERQPSLKEIHDQDLAFTSIYLISFKLFLNTHFLSNRAINPNDLP